MDIWEKVPKATRLRCNQIQHSRKFSGDIIQEIRSDIMPLLNKYDDRLALVFVGSFGREEASETSDIDAFVLFRESGSRDEQIAKSLLLELKKLVDKINRQKGTNLRMASEGAFSNFCVLENLLSNIGGNKETNHILTQRLSLLVEGKAISTTGVFKASRKAILMQYLQELQPMGRRPIFLVNELARYYRTTCVDYEYKKNYVGKPWAIRLIKLRHSRKLFYFSALLPLLESLSKHKDMTPVRRIKWIEEQFVQYTPLERLILLLDQYGEKEHWQLLTLYNTFLELLASEERRKKLDVISFAHRRKNKEYQLMRNNAREFRKTLLSFMLSVEHWRESIENYVIC